MLGVQCLAHRLVAAVNANAVARNVRGRKKWEPHNVIPMGVRQEYIEAVLASGTMFPEQAGAEFAHSGAKVAQYVFVTAGDDLDAARVAAEGSAH
jgi:hypothetical protein